MGRVSRLEVEWNCRCGYGLFSDVVVVGVGLKEYLTLFQYCLRCFKELIVVEESGEFEFVSVDNNWIGIKFVNRYQQESLIWKEARYWTW